MINYELPSCVEIDGEKYTIRNNGDFRVILDLICALEDKNLTDRQRGSLALTIFYGDNIPDNIPEAIEKMMWFVGCGKTSDKKSNEPPLMNWEKDFDLYIAPMNKVLGQEIRALPYFHWWSFISTYMEIDGKSTFSTVVNIRQKLQKGQKLDDADKEFYKKNYDIINLTELSEEDKNWLQGDD